MEYAGRNAPRAFDLSELEALVNQCPTLEDLMLAITRSQGDGNERKSYQTLGKLQYLTHLSLLLDCRDLSLYTPDVSEDDESQEDDEEQTSSSDGGHSESEGEPSDYLCIYDPSSSSSSDSSSASADDESVEYPVPNLEPARHIRHFCARDVRTAMINAALDESMARSIFSAIFDSPSCGSIPQKRRHLELRPENGVYSEGLTGVMSTLARWWCVERELGDLSLRVTRIRSKGDWYAKHCETDTALAPAVEKIFRSIWPSNLEGPGSWMTDWSSIPLYSPDRHD
nr:hypothetical protein B0A51_04488 [Rachicladosporium sp. CCFEE 5018]